MRTAVLYVVATMCVLSVGIEHVSGGQRPIAMASAIRAHTDRQSSATFWYVFETGDPIDEEGLKMNVTHSDAYYFFRSGQGGTWMNDFCYGEQHNEGGGKTDENGCVTVSGVRDNISIQCKSVYTDTDVSNPRDSGMFGMFRYCTYRCSGESGQCAGAWPSGADLPPRPKTEPCFFSLTELAALADETADPPANGINIVDLYLHQSGSKGNGFVKEKEYCMARNLETAEDFLRYSGLDLYSFIVKTAEPIELAGVSAVGRVFTRACPEGILVNITCVAENADQKTHIFRSDYFLPIDYELIAGNSVLQQEVVGVYDDFTPFENPDIWDPNQYVRYKKDDWLSYVDPNSYTTDPNRVGDPIYVSDPNTLFDPSDPDFYDWINRLDTRHALFMEDPNVVIPDRILQVQLLPIHTEIGDPNLVSDPNIIDSVDVEFVESMELFTLASDDWLTECALFDFNGDGAVNLHDLAFTKK
jgi:hypothetical protein